MRTFHLTLLVNYLAISHADHQSTRDLFTLNGSDTSEEKNSPAIAAYSRHSV